MAHWPPNGPTCKHHHTEGTVSIDEFGGDTNVQSMASRILAVQGHHICFLSPSFLLSSPFQHLPIHEDSGYDSISEHFTVIFSKIYNNDNQSVVEFPLCLSSLWKDLFCLCLLIPAWGLLDPIARSSTFPREARTYHFIIFFSLPFDQFHLFHPLYTPCLWQPPFCSL